MFATNTTSSAHSTGNPLASNPFGLPSNLGSTFAMPNATGTTTTGVFGTTFPTFSSQSPLAFGGSSSASGLFSSPVSGFSSSGFAGASGNTTGVFGTTFSPSFSTISSQSPLAFGVSSSASGLFSSPVSGFSSSASGHSIANQFTSSPFGMSSNTGSTFAMPNASATTSGVGGFGGFASGSGPSAFGVKSSSGASSTSGLGFSSTPTVSQWTAVFGRSDQLGATISSFGTQSSFSGSHVSSPPFGGQTRGSRTMTYKKTADVDSSAQNPEKQVPISFVSISAMPIYKDKSFEELRCEDYQSGDKGGFISRSFNPKPNGFNSSSFTPSTSLPSFSFTSPSPLQFTSPVTPTPSLSFTPPSVTPAPSFSFTPSVTPAPSLSFTPPSVTPAPSFSFTPSVTPAPSLSFTPPSVTPAPSFSFTPSVTPAPSFSFTPSVTPAPSLSFTPPSVTPAPSVSFTPSPVTPSPSLSFTPPSVTPSPSFSFTPSVTPAPSLSFTTSPITPTPSLSFTPPVTPAPSIFTPPVTPTSSIFTPPVTPTSSIFTPSVTPASSVNPYGTLPPVTKISIAGPRSVPTVHHGISSLPIQEKLAPVRVPSLLTVRHISWRNRWRVQKYDPKVNGPKVPFFVDREIPDPQIVPRENPRALVIRPTEHWPLRTNLKNFSAVEGKLSSIHIYDNGENRLGDVDTYSEKPEMGHPDEDSTKVNEWNSAAKVHEVEKLLPKLQLSGYYTEPGIQEMAAKERAEPGFCSHVKDFVIGRHGYGSIKFTGQTDVRSLDLESIIIFNNREVIVYKDESKKPPVGQGLNKQAEVTLLNIKCFDKKTGNQYMDGPRLKKYIEMLTKKAKEQGADFVSYDPVGGKWKFRVQHF